MWSNILAWNDVTTKDVYLLIIICSIMYIFIFHVVDNMSYKLDNCLAYFLNYGCVWQSDNKTIQKYLEPGVMREDGYYIGNDNDTNGKINQIRRKCNLDVPVNKCMITTWEVYHILFHMFLGYKYNLYVSLLLGLSFELLESKVYNCGSYLDLFYNMVGFLVGLVLKGNI